MTGQVAIVTGAGSGIGRAVTLGLLARGGRVALAGRREDALRATLADAEASGTAGASETAGAAGAAGAGDLTERALVIPTDVTDAGAVGALFAGVAARWGRIDLLFNNAGRFGAGAPFDELDVEDWRSVVDTNLTGCFLCAREAFRAMKAQSPQGGRIINNGSVSAHAPRPQAAAYTATKHAITGLTKAISLEGRPYRIACGQIDIGNAVTELSAGIGRGILQADGSTRAEPMMDVSHGADAVLHMAALPLEANVLFMTVMATSMPLVGRG